MSEEWLVQVLTILAGRPDGEETPELLGQRIHRALEIAEVEKYATPKSRFEFTVVGGTDEDLAKVREQLTPFEQSLVEIRRK